MGGRYRIIDFVLSNMANAGITNIGIATEKMIINEKYVSFGSTNITKKAFGQLSELNLFVKNNNSKFIKELYADVEKNCSLARKINNYEEIKYNRLLAFFEGFLV